MRPTLSMPRLFLLPNIPIFITLPNQTFLSLLSKQMSIVLSIFYCLFIQVLQSIKITFKISFKTDFIYVCIGAHECRCLHSLEIKDLLELEIHTVVNYMAVILMTPSDVGDPATALCEWPIISLFSYYVAWWCMKIHIISSPVIYAKFGFSSMHSNVPFVEMLNCLTAHTAFHVPSLWRADIFHIFISHCFVSLLLPL